MEFYYLEMYKEKSEHINLLSIFFFNNSYLNQKNVMLY